MEFKGKNVLITGGSRGIGRAIALHFANLGANVAITYQGNKEAADETLAAILEKGVSGLSIRGDISNPQDVAEMTEVVYAEFGQVDVLVNNAGITKDGLLIRMKESDWDAVLDTNLKGTYLCTLEVGKRMLKAKKGRIVNITSVVGVMGNAGQANYAASKAGVIGFTKSVAKEFASRGITVNAVAPGFIETDMTEKLGAELIESYKKAIPLQKFGTAADVAQVVAFLSSEGAAYLTGQVIQVDGGMHM